MAAKHVSMALGALVLGAWMLAGPSARGQEESVSPARAREALSKGIELYKNRDFETAEKFFTLAQAGQQTLTPPEVNDLASFRTQNSLALTARQEGALQLQQAEAAFKQGRTKDAVQFLNTLNANQYLTSAERQQVNELNRKVQGDTSSKAPSAKDKDAKALLAAGRDALKLGDLDRAEGLANQAEKATTVNWFSAWNDTPAKLRRDIQVARAKLQQPDPKTPADKGWFDRLLGKNDSPPTPTPEPKTPDTAPKNPDATSTSKFGGLWPFGGSSAPPAKKEPTSEDRVDAMIARKMVSDGFGFLAQGDFGKAHLVATKAKELNVAWGPDEQTPDMLLKAIQVQTGVPAQPTPTQPAAAAPKKAAPEVAQKKPVEFDPKADPRVLLKQGRALLEQRKLDDADKACSLALAAKASWGFWEDTPEKLRRDLAHARQTADRDEAVRLMVEARKAFVSGNLEDAESKAYKAQKLHGPYSAFDFGERPARLLEDVRQAKLKTPAPTQIAKKDPETQTPKEAPTGIPAGIQSANKNRAIVIVREARELERQGQLADARQKALEARALKAAFLPDEDSPDNVLLSLSAQANRKIQAHMQQSVAAVGVVNDPERFLKASAELLAARNLALVFELDLNRLDVAAAQLQQVQMGTQPATAMAAPPSNDPFQFNPAGNDVPTGDPKKDQARKLAREKLMYAQRELSAGKYTSAARMAEELCNPMYGVQEDAMRLLRSINAEEYNQQILEAKRAFESGLDCVVKKDYRKAMFIFQAIDPKVLPAQYQQRMSDVMAMREMQPQAPEQQYSKPAILMASTIEEKGGPAAARGANPGPDDILANAKAMEKVQFDMLRQRGNEALKTAHEKFKAGQKLDAVRTLEAYVQQVNEAGLSDNARSNELRRPAETRIQQYQTLIADGQLKNAGGNTTFVRKYDEAGRQKKIQDQQQEVAAMVREGAELYKQNKLQEAEAMGRKILEIDRENQAALILVMTAHVKYRQEQYDKDTRENDEGFIDLLKHNTLPPGMRDPDHHPVAFDPEIRKRHDGANGGSGALRHDILDAKERAIEYRLKQPISLNFTNTPLRDAITAMSIQSGVQVVPDMRALQEAKVNLDAPLTGNADNINFKNALNILLKPMRLTYIIEDQVLKITTEDRTVGRLVRITYPIADLVVPVEDHPLPDVYDITKVLQRSDALVNTGFMNAYGGGSLPFSGMNPGVPVGSHGGGGGGGPGLGGTFGSAGQSGSGGSPKQRTKETVAAELKELIMNTISKNTWEDMGGTGVIQFFPQGLALVISQPQEVQEEVQLLLATLRKLQDLQVSVELRAVLVSETFFERIGVDFNMNIETPISRTQPNLLNNTFVPAPFLNQTGRGLNVVSGLTSAGTLTPDLGIPINNHSFAFTTPQFGGYQPTAGLQLGLAFLSDIQVYMFLEAVQGDRRAHIMQAPKLTVYNGQTATITGVMTRPSVTGMVPNQMANGALFMSPITVGIPFGLTMQVQPVVSPDRRFIRLNVTPTLVGQAFQDPAAAIVTAIPQAINTTLDGGIQIPPLPNNQLAVTIQPQSANVFIAQTTVNVPDGGTVLLGGFKFLAEERTEYGPPVLSNIPYLSRLFRNVGWSRDGSTLIYLVTARVIMIEEEENIFLGNIAPIPGR